MREKRAYAAGGRRDIRQVGGRSARRSSKPAYRGSAESGGGLGGPQSNLCSEGTGVGEACAQGFARGRWRFFFSGGVRGATLALLGGHQGRAPSLYQGAQKPWIPAAQGRSNAARVSTAGLPPAIGRHRARGSAAPAVPNASSGGAARCALQTPRHHCLSPSAAVYLRQRDAGPPPAPILRCYQSPDHDRQEGPQRCPIPMFPAPHVHRSAVARYGCAEIWINVAPCAIGRTGPSPAALLPPSLFTRSAPGRRFGWRARCNFVLPGGLPPTHAARSAAPLARGRDRRRPACVVGSGQALRCAWTRPPPPPPSCSAALRLVRSAG